MKYSGIREEEIKNRVAQDFFDKFDCTEIIKNIDFAVKSPRLRTPLSKPEKGEEYLLWAEAKQKPADIVAMLAQLVLTIGKARTFDKILPPPFLGCFDREKIAFVPYADIQDIFYRNDFNWKVAPSDYETREFRQAYEQIKKIVDNDIPYETYLFYFEKDEKELKQFIRENFTIGKSETAKIKIDKNNFITIYNKWLEAVKPAIAVNWDMAKKKGIIDGDFYLADLLSQENVTLKEKIFVLLKTNHYELDRKIDEAGLFDSKKAQFTDKQKSYYRFWAKYERPPSEEYWDYIIERRDLIVPQDVRERKGSFYTPRIWVELSQKYIADVLGDDWQDEYYVWDCAAGTGNLLAGLTNKYNIWASTLDKADVDVMHDRTDNGANLLHEHVFQFDFLNDDFTKLPVGLQKIVNDPQKRRKLVVYINPPYAEAGDTKQRTGTGKNKEGTTTANAIYEKYKNVIGKANNELFTQFLTRIYCEIPACMIANFSKLKNLQSSNFQDFRKIYQAKLEKIFLVPADTFDNVRGQFPIGFFIWDTEIKEPFEQITADVFDKDGYFKGQKIIMNYDSVKGSIVKWMSEYKDKTKTFSIGMINTGRNDFQNQNLVYIKNEISDVSHSVYITQNNLLYVSIYFSVRKVIPADWLNDRDQFLYPNDGWKTDAEFQNDCLAYTLFNNNIQSRYGVNHWIPFTENEVNSRDKFDSRFMTDFIGGKIKPEQPERDLFSSPRPSAFPIRVGERTEARTFSPEAQSVFDAGRELWRYYHARPECDVNASLYDIREYFQGRNDKDKMNNKSDDEIYNRLIGNLRTVLKTLALKIEPKVYEYGFLKK